VTLQIRHATHPEQLPGFDTAALRRHYLVDDLFVPDAITAVLTHHDRIVLAGARPTNGPLTLETYPQLRSEYFLERREAGIVNVGGPGTVTANRRTIDQYIHADGVQSCQVVLGVTTLHAGSTWNTMPAHTHDRRTECYLYFGLPETERIVHLLGEPDETRHVLVADRQAIISPSWSIHSGCGTSSYSFVWAMAGENQAFGDMDGVDVQDLR
jgi:5-keto 4-deoxyuronate isomerase